MLKLEIKLDEARITAENKYSLDSIYGAIEQAFAKYNFRGERLADGTLCYYGNGMAKDYGIFGRLITSLKDKAWFMEKLVKWLWYNSDDGENENDYTIEDVLYHYTKRESAA